MSYMGLLWETGMPEAWALSRKSGEKPMIGAAAECWPQNLVDLGTFRDPAHEPPEDGAGRPVPKPDGGKETDG